MILIAKLFCILITTYTNTWFQYKMVGDKWIQTTQQDLHL